MVQTSVLLPAARVDVFSKQEHTLELIKSFDDDWRFARIILGLQESSLDAAIEYYKTHDSPNLIVIQMEKIGDDFSDHLEQLAANCSEETECLIIGPENDIQLYRQLTEMGVSDYLVHPVAGEDFISSMAKVLLARLGQTDSQLISVIGAKGGVGATAITQLIATAMAHSAQQKTLVMDAASAWSDMAVSMGFEPSAQLKEVFSAVERADTDSLARMVLKTDDKLHVLGSGTGHLFDPSVTENEYEAIIDYMMQHHPYVVVDLSQTKDSIKKTVLARSHAIFVVTTPTLYAIRTARGLIKELREIGGEETATKFKLVVNKQGRSSTNEVGKSDFKGALDVEPDVIIPYEPKVFLGSETSGKLLEEDPLGKKIQYELLQSLDDILGNILKFVKVEKTDSLGDKMKTLFKK